LPPVPAFLHHQPTLEDMIDQTVYRGLDQLDIALPKRPFFNVSLG
jgi:3-polyprenyl-4-hydroxybenzoate decarboxylase